MKKALSKRRRESEEPEDDEKNKPEEPEGDEKNKPEEPDDEEYKRFTFDGNKPPRPPITRSFLKKANISELYLSGIWLPDFDADDEFDTSCGHQTPKRNRLLCS